MEVLRALLFESFKLGVGKYTGGKKGYKRQSRTSPEGMNYIA
jgi:hypothetical protein